MKSDKRSDPKFEVLSATNDVAFVSEMVDTSRTAKS